MFTAALCIIVRVWKPLRASLAAQTVKNLPGNAGDSGSIPGWERALGVGNGHPLQYSCLENPHGQRTMAG